MVVELRPDGIGKGNAVQDLMRVPPFQRRIPVMFGDDATDEPAFALANRMGGLSVKVGPGATLARHRLPNRPPCDDFWRFGPAREGENVDE
jgi:trehalose 6-phosphate phosphatase